MMKRKLKAITIRFLKDTLLTVVEHPGQAPVAKQISKDNLLSGVPSPYVIEWKKKGYEVFDLMLSNGWVVREIWYERVALCDKTGLWL